MSYNKAVCSIWAPPPPHHDIPGLPSECQGGCRPVDVEDVGADPAGPDLVQPRPHRGGGLGHHQQPGESVRPAGWDRQTSLWHRPALPSQPSPPHCLVQRPDPGSHLQVLLQCVVCVWWCIPTFIITQGGAFILKNKSHKLTSNCKVIMLRHDRISRHLWDIYSHHNSYFSWIGFRNITLYKTVL